MRISSALQKGIIGASLLLNLILSPLALAASSVQFEGGAENFVFYPSNGWNDADLFGGLKNMMPGDRRTESITVKNIATDYDYVKIFLRAESLSSATETTAESGQPSMAEFLSKLTLNIYQGDNLISSASADNLGGLSSNLLLGTFHGGDETTLTVEVIAPTSLSNKYMNAVGEIDWLFTAEAYKDGVMINPNTGVLTTSSVDGVTAGWCIAIALILAIFFILCYHRYTAHFTNKH